jgi:hypothetical protein
MPVDQLRYDVLVQEALRGMVRDVLAETVNKGLPGDHHFFITFDTAAEGVQLSQRLRAQYPEEMTIVLQHQFWDLKVSDLAFEVGLSFGGATERLHIPFAAIKAFADPSVQFTLQFETLTETADDAAAEPARSPAGPQAPARPTATEPPSDEPANPSGAEVVRLDRFRKK